MATTRTAPLTHGSEATREAAMAAFAKSWRRDAVEAEDLGRSSQHSALLEREDCTLVAWYRSLYAPRTGGRMTVTIGRRELLAALGGAAAIWPRAARGQQPAMPVIGLLDQRSPDVLADRLRAFRQGLKEAGLIE